MANVFFTVSTGYINIALAERLKRKGYLVTALVSTQEAAKAVEKVGATVLWGEINKPETYAGAIKGSDIVVHTPDIYDLDFGKSESHVVDTIIDALKGSDKTFIYTSNTWVLGDTGHVLADEKTVLAPVTLVAPLAQSETKVLEAAKQDIRSIVIRPATIYGYETGYVEEYVTHSRKERVAYYIGEGDNYLSLVHIEDLLDLYVAAIDKATAGTVFHGASNGYIRGKELAELVAKTFGIQEKQGLSLSEARGKYGALTEGYALSQQIDYVNSRSALKWETKQSGIADYLIQREKALAVSAR